MLCGCSVAGVVEGSPAAAVSGLRPGAELLAVQEQSVAGWSGHCTLRLLRERANERPLRLVFSAGVLASQLSSTELLGTTAAGPIEVLIFNI